MSEQVPSVGALPPNDNTRRELRLTLVAKFWRLEAIETSAGDVGCQVVLGAKPEAMLSSKGAGNGEVAVAAGRE